MDLRQTADYPRWFRIEVLQLLRHPFFKMKVGVDQNLRNDPYRGEGGKENCIRMGKDSWGLDEALRKVFCPFRTNGGKSPPRSSCPG